MPKVVAPLTDTQVKNAKPRDKEYNLSHGKGLQLRIKPSGRKVWLFNYFRPYSKKRANLKIGEYPNTTLAQATSTRNKYLALVEQSIDPQEHEIEEGRKTLVQKEATLSNVSNDWLEIKRTTVSEDYAEKVKRMLELHVFKSLGSYPIDKLTAPIVIESLKSLEAKGSLETLRRICQKLNEIMTWAVNTGVIHHNPLSGIKAAFKSPVVRNQLSIPPTELPAFMMALQRASIKFVTRCLIEWELHTLTRPSEAAHAKWSEIDLDNDLWIIPAERMKMKRDHVIPISPQAKAILMEMQPISANYEFIFPSDRAIEKPMSEQTANMAIKRMGYKGKLVAHGLRSLGSTVLNEEGFAPDIIEAALAHVDKNQVRSAYNRTDYLERRKVMMCWWSEYILQASIGSNSVTGYRGLKAV
jgi:integrase